MSRLPAILNAIMRKADAALPAEPEREARANHEEAGRKRPDENRTEEKRADDDRETIFNLLPPDAGTKSMPEPEPQPEPNAASEPEPESPAAPASRNVHPIGISDLGRLSIDNDGRLYWDGKQVEVRRRIMMSRAQVIGASIIGAFVVIGAIGAAIQASAAARDWGCRLGWATTYCSVPEFRPSTPSDIPV
jgi:hypothetical protein